MPNIVRSMKLLSSIIFLVFTTFLLQREFHSISNTMYSSKHLKALRHTLADDGFLNVMQTRIETLKSMCTRQDVRGGSSLTSEASLGISGVEDADAEARLWLLKEEKVAWCPVPKTASTSWKINLLNFRANDEQIKSLIKRYKIPEHRLKHVGIISPTIQEWKAYASGNTANLTSFIIVRHPFDRLVSSFRSIFESGWFADAGSQIVKSFRHKSKYSRRLVQKELFLADRSQLSKIKNKSKYPTFREFVQAVLRNLHYVDLTSGSNLEVHWRPMYQQCSVCHPTKLSTLKYILKYEHLAEEEDEFLRLLGWNNIIKQTVRSNIYDAKSKILRNRSEITKMYFNTLHSYDLHKLYEKYKPDFELFGYEFKLSDW